MTPPPPTKKRKHYIQGTKKRIAGNVSSETMQSGEEHNDIFKGLKEKHKCKRDKRDHSKNEQKLVF